MNCHVTSENAKRLLVPDLFFLLPGFTLNSFGLALRIPDGIFFTTCKHRLIKNIIENENELLGSALKIKNLYFIILNNRA